MRAISTRTVSTADSLKKKKEILYFSIRDHFNICSLYDFGAIIFRLYLVTFYTDKKRKLQLSFYYVEEPYVARIL